MLTTFQYFALTTLLLGWLAAIGYPLRRLLDQPDGPRAPVPAPMVGMAVVQVVGWYWLEAGGQGLRVPATILTALAAVALVTTMVRDQRHKRHADRRRLALCAGALAGAAAVIGLNFSAVLSLGYLTTGDNGSNDAAQYALVADHIVHGNFSDEGQIEGYDLGERTRTDGFGSSVVLASYAALTGIDVFRLNNVVLFAFVALSVYSLALLINELLAHNEALAAAVSIAAACTPLFIFITVTFFIGQVQAMAVLPLMAIVGLRAAGTRDRALTIRLLVSAATLFLILLSHYAHMAFLAPPVLLPALLLASASTRLSWAELWRRLRQISIVFAGGLLLAVVLSPLWLRLGLSVTTLRSTVVAGFPLPGFLPVELMGFMRHLPPQPSVARVAWSVVVLALFGIAAWVARGSYRALIRFTVGVTTSVLLSYLLVYAREGGPTYRQWKWITYFQPLLVACVAITILLAVGIGLRGRLKPATGVILTVIALVYAAIVSTYTGNDHGTALRDHRQIGFTSRDSADLAKNPAFEDLDSVNIDLGPVWDTLWAVYFLRDKELRIQSDDVKAPAAKVGWTLIPTTMSLSGSTVRPVNRSHQLLQTVGGPRSAQPSGLDAAVTVELDPVFPGDAALSGTAEVTNTGTASWLPSGAVPGSVNLGVHLADSTGTLIEHGWQRFPLTTGITVPIPPGTTVTIPFSVSAPQDAGSYLITFQPVAERVAWFGTGSPLDISLPG